MQTLDRMPAAKPTALSPVRLALLVLSCAALPLLCRAARRVPVFVVDVSGQSAPALQQAMRAALVRATGHPESATDPVFAPLVAQAQKYVVNYQRGPQGELQVAFNGAQVERAINGLGRSVWSAERPFTLIVLSPMPGQADYEADHAALEQAAQARGLPISIMPLPVTDSSGQLLAQNALLGLVHRFGAEQLLVGQPPAPAAAGPSAAPAATPAPTAPQGPANGPPETAVTAPPPRAPTGAGSSLPGQGSNAPPSSVPPASPQWQWTLITPFLRRTFTGPLTAGIDGTVDLLAPPAVSGGDGLSEARVRIEGVSSLTDYGHIELMLEAMPGVTRADVSEVRGNTAVFDLRAAGGAATVARMLATSPHFSPAHGQAGGGALVYRYLPGPAATAPPATAPATTPAAH